MIATTTTIVRATTATTASVAMVSFRWPTAAFSCGPFCSIIDPETNCCEEDEDCRAPKCYQCECDDNECECGKLSSTLKKNHLPRERTENNVRVLLRFLGMFRRWQGNRKQRYLHLFVGRAIQHFWRTVDGTLAALIIWCKAQCCPRV